MHVNSSNQQNQTHHPSRKPYIIMTAVLLVIIIIGFAVIALLHHFKIGVFKPYKPNLTDDLYYLNAFDDPVNVKNVSSAIASKFAQSARYTDQFLDQYKKDNGLEINAVFHGLKTDAEDSYKPNAPETQYVNPDKSGGFKLDGSNSNIDTAKDDSANDLWPNPN